MKRDGFGSQLGTLMALIGSAVGLGNLWKFPYMAGKNGGAAFILLYVGFMLLLCLPLMLSEFIIGRRSQSNPVGAFRKLSPGTNWYYTGMLGVITAFIILSFYSVVGGWAVKYLITSLHFGFADISGAAEYFSSFTQSPLEPLFMHLIFLFFTVAVLWTGIKNGIEKYSKILMPLLFFMIVILAVYSITLPGSSMGLVFLLKPDFSSVTPHVVLDALGQGLFSLSLGMGIVITYSSYMNKKEDLTKVAILTIVMDLVFALLAGFFILPAVFAFGFQPDEGPGLLFIILPQVFSKMPFGNIFAIIFFIVLLIAALTSAISLLEVVVSYLSEEKKLARRKALVITGVLLAITGSICSLSLGKLSGVKLFDNNIFDIFDKISSIYMMPAGAFFISLFVGWKMKKADVKDEMSNSGRLQVRSFNLFIWLVRYFVPVAIVVIFLGKLGVFKSLFE